MWQETFIIISLIFISAVGVMVFASLERLHRKVDRIDKHEEF